MSFLYLGKLTKCPYCGKEKIQHIGYSFGDPHKTARRIFDINAVWYCRSCEKCFSDAITRENIEL